MSKHKHKDKAKAEGVLAETSLTVRELDIVLLALDQAADYGIFSTDNYQEIDSDEIETLTNKLMIVEALADQQLAPELAFNEAFEQSDESQQRMYDLMDGADSLITVNSENNELP